MWVGLRAVATLYHEVMIEMVALIKSYKKNTTVIVPTWHMSDRLSRFVVTDTFGHSSWDDLAYCTFVLTFFSWEYGLKSC